MAEELNEKEKKQNQNELPLIPGSFSWSCSRCAARGSPPAAQEQEGTGWTRPGVGSEASGSREGQGFAGQEPRGSRASGHSLSSGVRAGRWASSEAYPYAVESFFGKFNLKKKEKGKKKNQPQNQKNYSTVSLSCVSLAGVEMCSV